MTRYAYFPFAQAYGSGAYSNCTYNCVNGQSTSANGSTSGNGSGTLANTGIAVAAVVTAACLILLIALIVRIIGRRSKAAEAVPADDGDDEIERQRNHSEDNE